MTSASTVLNAAFQNFRVVTKNRCHLRHHTFKKSQKYLYRGKNIKKIFLQLRCSNVLLHSKCKILLCEPKLNLGTFREEKPQQRTIVVSQCLAYGWRMGNLNWPIRIQQAGKNLLSSRQCKLTGKALKPGNFSHWRWH